MGAKIHTNPSHVAAEKGEVIIDGPDGVAFSLAPDAAIETGERLIDRGIHAQGQRVRTADAKVQGERKDP